MNNPEDIIEELKKEETKEIMKKIVEEKIEKEKQKKEKIEILMSNTDYIKWLIDFTKDKEVFSDDDWDYSNEKLSDADQEKVNDLSLFFEGIYHYAKKNYIYSSLRSLGEYYRVKIDNQGFEIGYITGQGTIFYCKRISLEEKDIIDFMDIVNDKKQDNVEYIEKNLKNLSDLFIDLYSNGVPIEAIIETFNKIVSSINRTEQEKTKVKSKTL